MSERFTNMELELAAAIKGLAAALDRERDKATAFRDALVLSRCQFAWIEREAGGDNEAGRIVHACQRAFEAIDAAVSPEGEACDSSS